MRRLTRQPKWGGALLAAIVGWAACSWDTGRPAGNPESTLVVQRTIMPDSDPSSFAVDFPDRVSFCFDPVRGGINYVWQGDFADFSPARTGKFVEPIHLLGEVFYRESLPHPLRPERPDRVPRFQFRGYRLQDGFPVFLYTLDETPVEEEIRPLEDAPGLVRLFRVPAPGATFWFLLEEQPRAEVSSRTGRREENVLRFEADSAGEFEMTVRMEDQR